MKHLKLYEEFTGILPMNIPKETWEKGLVKNQDFANKLKVFWEAIKQEKEEYKEIIPFIKKVFRNEQLTEDERKKLNQQLIDTLKIPVDVALFMLPGGGLILPGLVWLSKKFGLNMLPSAFDQK